MKKSIPFFKAIGESLMPSRYDDLVERSNKDAFKYYLSLIYLAFMVTVLIFLPLIGQIPTKLDAAFSHFDKLELKLNTKMNSALVLPDTGTPKITIDTRVDEAELTRGDMLITDEYIYYKDHRWGRDQVVREKVSTYEDLLGNREATIWFVTIVAFLMMPTIVFLIYAGIAIKILVFVMIALFLALIITRISRFYVEFNKMLKMALYTTTPGVILFVIIYPLYYYVSPEYWIRWAATLVPLLVSTIYYVIVIKNSGETESPRQRRIAKRVKKQRGGYVELKA
jgi:hypothetical protein